MYRSDTRFGAMTTALASAGTLIFRSTVSTARTCPPSGSTVSIEPTLTPRTRTSEPG